jgi:hypothetical protein
MIDDLCSCRFSIHQFAKDSLMFQNASASLGLSIPIWAVVVVKSEASVTLLAAHHVGDVAELVQTSFLTLLVWALPWKLLLLDRSCE